MLHAKSAAAAGTISSLEPGLAPLPVYQTGGQDDPYTDLLWLSAPPLAPLSGNQFAFALASGGSFAFQSPGRNDAFGGPFMITGCQSWGLSAFGTGTASGGSAIVYAASGPEGKRYLPLAVLQDSGTLHTLTKERSSTTLGSAPGAVPPRK
ncbi:hypothetical protein AMQ84_00455 [Paenibacillus riograndensis]|uniref:Uncharacterized protein n=2 Tax=Paenibacillus riograndensis TaxID=483937 RepID=A0A132UBY7_9BACL|nr:hypothetical protein AMQ84_00455 [Paenibacillus riograndensis]